MKHASLNENSTWFLAQLKPNSARIAQINLHRQGFEAFLPLEERTEQRNGKLIAVQKPLFPGYIFVSFDADKGRWRSVNSTQGITRLVSFGRGPAAVPSGLMSELMAFCAGQKERSTQNKLPEIGARVVVKKGPFTDFIGEITAISADQRVWVLLDIMGGRTRVAMDANHVRFD